MAGVHPIRWRTAEPGDDRCQWPRCRQAGEVRYMAGATPLNKGVSVWVCQTHELELIGRMINVCSSSRRTVRPSRKLNL